VFESSPVEHEGGDSLTRDSSHISPVSPLSPVITDIDTEAQRTKGMNGSIMGLAWTGPVTDDTGDKRRGSRRAPIPCCSVTPAQSEGGRCTLYTRPPLVPANRRHNPNLPALFSRNKLPSLM